MQLLLVISTDGSKSQLLLFLEKLWFFFQRTNSNAVAHSFLRRLYSRRKQKGMDELCILATQINSCLSLCQVAPWGFTPPNKGTAPGLPFGKQKQHSGRRPAVTSSLQGPLLASCSGGGLCMPCIPIWGWKCRYRSISKVKRLAW